jgi:hypothetical protein
MGEVHRRPNRLRQGAAVSGVFSCWAQTAPYWQRQRVGTCGRLGLIVRRGSALSIGDTRLRFSSIQLDGVSGFLPFDQLPILANRKFTVPYPRKDDALSAARKRIDVLLAVQFDRPG